VERVQDGIDRIEFLAGKPALEFVESRSELVESLSAEFETQPDNLKKVLLSLKRDFEQLKKNYRNMARKLAEEMRTNINNITLDIGKIKFVFNDFDYLDEQAHITIGDTLVSYEPKLVYVGYVIRDGKGRLVVVAGTEAINNGISASDVVKEVSKSISGSGGGTKRLGQGGGEASQTSDLIKKKVVDVLKTTLGVE
jgi:alanyl-tRNA synthetase